LLSLEPELQRDFLFVVKERIEQEMAESLTRRGLILILTLTCEEVVICLRDLWRRIDHEMDLDRIYLYRERRGV
jgi:hypothetical protein